MKTNVTTILNDAIFRIEDDDPVEFEVRDADDNGGKIVSLADLVPARLHGARGQWTITIRFSDEED